MGLSNVILGQESFKKRYVIRKAGDFPLKESVIIKYKDLEPSKRDSIKAKFPIGSKISTVIERRISGKKVSVNEEITVGEEFWHNQTVEENIIVEISTYPIKCFALIEDNKVWINPFLKRKDGGKYGDYAKRKVYFYELENRQNLKLWFNEWTVSPLTIPIKYRFGTESENGKKIDPELTAGINANLFAGWTLGRTNFFHRKKVGNLSNNLRLTIGAILGVSTIELNKSNTNPALPDETKLTKGLASLGSGLTISYNKINFGAFIGWDFGVGNQSNNWNYNKKPWVGLGVGYGILFK